MDENLDSIAQMKTQLNYHLSKRNSKQHSTAIVQNTSSGMPFSNKEILLKTSQSPLPISQSRITMMDKQASSILNRTSEKPSMSATKRLQNVKFVSAPHSPKGGRKGSKGKNMDLVDAGGVDLPAIL